MYTNGTTREESITMTAIQEMARNQIELRDYLAGQVIAVYVGGNYRTSLALCENDEYKKMVQKFARNAYKVADAMLEARKEHYTE